MDSLVSGQQTLQLNTAVQYNGNLMESGQGITITACIIAHNYVQRAQEFVVVSLSSSYLPLPFTHTLKVLQKAIKVPQTH